VNTLQRLVVAVGVLALLAMCAYPPRVHTKAGWVWEDGSIDTARLGIQCILVSGIAGLLAYVLRPAGIQAFAKRKKLVIVLAMAGIQAIAKRKKLVIVSAMVVGIAGSTVLLSLWWYSLPTAQVGEISAEEPKPKSPKWLTDAEVMEAQPAPIAIPGLPEIDSSWWGDPDALAKHMQLRIAMSVTNPQASVSTWLQRHNYFAEQPVQWKILLDDKARSIYVDKDTASIEYYRCLGDAEKIRANRQSVARNDEFYEFCEADKRAEAKAWKILMDAGGGLSMHGRGGSAESGEGFSIHLVLPGETSAAAYYVRNRGDEREAVVALPRLRDERQVVLVQGRIVALNAGEVSSYVILNAALTGKATSLSADP